MQNLIKINQIQFKQVRRQINFRPIKNALGPLLFVLKKQEHKKYIEQIHHF